MVYKNSEEENIKAFSEATIAVRDAMRQFIQRRLRKQKIDITYEMHQVIQVLIEHKKINQVQIANILGKDKASITYILDGLSKRKIVIRETDPGDRRRNIITLTKEGHMLQRKVMKIVGELYHQLAGEKLSDNFLQKMTDGLINIKKNVEGK